MKLTLNQIIDKRYRVTEKLDQGGMGAVWKVLDTRFDDDVVLKIPLESNNEQILRRFGDEIQTMRKLSKHCPHVLNIMDVGEFEGLPYYVMQYQAGGSLRRRIQKPICEGKDGKWSAKSFDWLPRIGEALD